MTSVPPTNNDDPDETPKHADSPANDSAAMTSSAGASSGADSGTAGFDHGLSAAEEDTTSAAGVGSQAGAETTAASTASPSGVSAEEPVAAEDDSATRRLPTEEEDEELRAERERRFGRVAGQPATEETTATPVPETTAEPVEPADTGEPQTTVMPPPAPREEEDPFADFDEGPTSRAAAHWWGILIAVVFGPVAWYLIADGGERVSYALGQNVDAINVLGLVELAGGLIALVILLLAARWSSVGSIIIGSIGALIGGAFVIIPGIVADFLSAQSMIFDRLGQFGMNVFDRLTEDGHAGRLLAYGIAFIFVGVVSHGARRQGRREERRKAALGE